MGEQQTAAEMLLLQVKRMTGKIYQINFHALDLHSIRELQRLLRDLEYTSKDISG
jgi:hypothetical protein